MLTQFFKKNIGILNNVTSAGSSDTLSLVYFIT